MRDRARALGVLVLAVLAGGARARAAAAAIEGAAGVTALARERAHESSGAPATTEVGSAPASEESLASEVLQLVLTAPSSGGDQRASDDPQGAGNEPAVEVTPAPPIPPEAGTGASVPANAGSAAGAAADKPSIIDLVPPSALGARSVAPRPRALDKVSAGSASVAGEDAKPAAVSPATQSAPSDAPLAPVEPVRLDGEVPQEGTGEPDPAVPPAATGSSTAPASSEAQTTGADIPIAETPAGGEPMPVTQAPHAEPPLGVTPPGAATPSVAPNAAPPNGSTASASSSASPPDATTVGAPPTDTPATLAPPLENSSERARRSIASLRSACEELARAHPDLCELRTLGQSRNGLEIPLAVIGDTRSGTPSRRPALFACAEIANASETAPDALVRAISDLLARAATQPEVLELLRTRTIYLVPAPDPDRFYEPDPELAPGGVRRVELDRNFPSGWRPEGRGGGSAGPYPLSENESNALARFLRGASNVAAVLVAPGAEDVQGSRPAEARAPGAGAGEMRTAGAGAPGSFERFCREILGAPVLRPGAELSQVAGEGQTKSLAGPSAADPLAAILRALPELEVGPAHVERLRANLWMVDVTVTNGGAFSTGEGVWLASSGARVVSLTMRSSAASPWQSARGPAPWALAPLAAGAGVRLRWIVEGEEGTELVLALDSRRAGIGSARVLLK